MDSSTSLISELVDLAVGVDPDPVESPVFGISLSKGRVIRTSKRRVSNYKVTSRRAEFIRLHKIELIKLYKYAIRPERDRFT